MKLHNTKRLLCGVLASVLMLGITACGHDASGDLPRATQTDESAAADSSAESVAAESTENADSASTESADTENAASDSTDTNSTTEETTDMTSELIPDLTMSPYELPESEGLSFVKDLKIGWNLGNTFDAVDCNWLDDELKYESAWCGAKTLETHIQSLKDAGFNAIRIPVSWHNHLTDKESYRISQPWLDRVTEVINYCIDRDMYVLVNIHHDNSTDFMYPSSEYLEQSVNYVTAIWEQLADAYKDYDEHLIFDGMNEPRLVGHKNEWWIDNNSADCKDAIDCINQLNQAFVDTVRASGGNNATRYLMCPGYDASPDGALNNGFILPSDPVESNDHHIIVSVHAYTPYNFALNDKGTAEWSSQSSADTSELTGFMDRLFDKYIKNGTAVIIDEFGARDKSDNLASRVDFAAYYIAAARVRGITCFWWDNNAFVGNGENFGLLDRASNTWKYPEIVEAMMRYAE